METQDRKPKPKPKLSEDKSLKETAVCLQFILKNVSKLSEPPKNK